MKPCAAGSIFIAACPETLVSNACILEAPVFVRRQAFFVLWLTKF
jgi:hypothetical protein